MKNKSNLIILLLFLFIVGCGERYTFETVISNEGTTYERKTTYRYDHWLGKKHRLDVFGNWVEANQ